MLKKVCQSCKQQNCYNIDFLDVTHTRQAEKYMPDHGWSREYNLWNASPIHVRNISI